MHMMKKLGICAALCLLNFSTAAFAYEVDNCCSYTQNGFFVGLGGSYNSVKLDQYLTASGTSEVFEEGLLVAFGEAGGPANPYHVTQTTFAPEVQVGYFDNLPCSDWTWGVTFLYKYLGIGFTQRVINAPQSGAFVNTEAAPEETFFTGHVIIGSAQNKINHELDLLAFMGHSFTNGQVYLGVGPVVFKEQTKVYQAIGFANVNGEPTDITGTPTNFSSCKWVWGGAAQIGFTYNLSPCWFLDLSYKYALTGKYKHNNAAPFASASSGFTDSGILNVNTTQRITVQSFAVSVNMLF